MSYVILPTESYQLLCDKLREKTDSANVLLASDIPSIVQNFSSDKILTEFLNGTLTNYSNDRVTSVESYAFYGLTKLTSIDLPNVTSVSTQAFNGCTALKTINAPSLKTTSIQSFYNCGFVSINLPSLTTVGTQGIRNCRKLTKADLKSVTTINTYAFDTCSVLETLIIRTDKVCNLANVNALTNTKIASGTGYIYVPNVLIENYKTATNWTTYADQIRAIEDYPEICGDV